ncbi:MAG: hypothetical protein ABSG84_13410 [Acidobacteriaceae bacterium]|jgi:hypothetical protein
MFDEINVNAEGRDEPKKDEGPPSWAGVMVAVVTLPVLMIFDYLGKFYLGLSITIWLGMNLLAIWLRWKLRRRAWFWVVIVFACALELPLVLLIPWQRIAIDRIALLPFGVAVIAITMGAVKLVETFIVKASFPDEEE